MTDTVTIMSPRERIEVICDEIADAAKIAADKRLYIAEQLAKAREIAEAEGEDWNDVLDSVVKPRLALKCGPREVRRLLLIGRAPDPVQAITDERRTTRERVATIRERGRTTSGTDRGPPVQRAIAAVQGLSDTERKAVVATLAAEVAPKRIAPPVKSPRERLIEAIDAADDETLAAVIAGHAWPRIGAVLQRLLSGRLADGTTFDPETGEIIEEPRATPAADMGKKAASHASEGGDHVTEPEATHVPRGGPTPGTANPVRPHPSIPPAGLADEDFDIPKFLDRRGELIRDDSDPAAPDDRPAPPKRVRAS